MIPLPCAAWTDGNGYFALRRENLEEPERGWRVWLLPDGLAYRDDQLAKAVGIAPPKMPWERR
jgi:hypothetical protein